MVAHPINSDVVGRPADVYDVMVNVCGASLGFVIYRIARRTTKNG